MNYNSTAMSGRAGRNFFKAVIGALKRLVRENPSTRDSKTGKPVDDTAALLGALASLNDLSRDNPKWSDWKIRGQELLNSKKSDSTT